MKRAWVVFVMVLCLLMSGCSAVQATLADSLESLYGYEGQTFEEHQEYYQAEWDALYADIGKLFGIATEEAEKFVEDKIQDAVEEILGGEEKKVENRIQELRDTYGNRYNGSGQCKGFARKVFGDLFGPGSVVPSTADNNYEFIETAGDSVDKIETIRNIQSKSDAEIKEAFSDARPGDLVQMRRTHGGPHTAVIISVSDEGMTWIEANLDGNNGIVVEEYTWSQIRDGKNGYRKNEHLTIYTATDYALHGQ